MTRESDPRTCGGDPDLLRDYGREGACGRSLRADLASRFPDRPVDELEDAVQSAFTAFLAEGAGITDPKSVNAWLRTVAHRSLLRDLKLRRRSGPVDPGGGVIGSVPSALPGPAEELIALEHDIDLDVLVEEVVDSLPKTRRDVLALWAAGRRRTEIAAELGLGERVVKRALEEIMAEARSTLARRAGEGCEEGGPTVMRLLCGLASAAEAARARAHLDSCDRCSTFAESLEAWREKAGAILPLPAAEVASPGLLGRTVSKVGEAASSVKRHVLGGGAQVKGRATAGVGASADPTPLAAIRPGAVAAVLAGCIAVGSGATYCAQQGVDPLGAAQGLIAGTEELAEEEKPDQLPEEKAPVTPSYEPAPEEAAAYQPEEEAPAPQTTTEAESKPSHESEPPAEAEPVVEEEEVTPPVEQSFEPASPDYPATETNSSSSESTSTESSTGQAAKAVPANEGPQFGGP